MYYFTKLACLAGYLLAGAMLGLAKEEPSSRIASGELYPDYPNNRWMARLYQNMPFCSGVMVDKWWLLTAAHCLQGRRAGSILVDGNFGTGRINQTIIHPGYSAQTLANNLALAQISNDLFINQWNPEPVILPESGQTFTSYATAAGFGTNSNRAINAYSVSQVQLPITALARCRSIYSDNIVLEDAICAGMGYTGQAICRGDAGAALVQELPVNQTDPQSPKHLVLLGIGSFGFECGNGKYPSVFTSIPYHVEWIRENVP